MIKCETNGHKRDRYSTIHYLTSSKDSFKSNHTFEPNLFTDPANSSTKAVYLQNVLTKITSQKQDGTENEIKGNHVNKRKRKRNKSRRKRKGDRKKIHNNPKDDEFANKYARKGKVKTLAKQFRNKRKHKKQKEPEKESSILEITTAKNRNQVVLDVNNSSLGVLIEKLNQNPEMNYNHLISSFQVDETSKTRQTELHSYNNNKRRNFLDDFSQSTTEAIQSLTVPLERSVNEVNTSNNELQVLFSGNNRTSYRNRYGKCNGCAHICDKTDPNMCTCLDGYYLAPDGRNCLGKSSEWRYYR